MKLVPWCLCDSQNLCHRATKKRENVGNRVFIFTHPSLNPIQRANPYPVNVVSPYGAWMLTQAFDRATPGIAFVVQKIGICVPTGGTELPKTSVA
jgi:hypothetical protein